MRVERGAACCELENLLSLTRRVVCIGPLVESLAFGIRFEGLKFRVSGLRIVVKAVMGLLRPDTTCCLA